MLFFYIIFFISLSSRLPHALGAAPQCNNFSDDEKFDCMPGFGENATEAICKERNCCWKFNLFSKAPYCFLPRDFPNYNVVSQSSNGTSYNIQKNVTTFLENEILNLKVDLFYDSSKRLRVKIYDPNNKRYEVPLPINSDFKKVDDNEYYVNVTYTPFAIKVYRASTKMIIFDTSIAPLLYSDQFIQFSTFLPNRYIYGVGEHRDTLQHQTDWKHYSLWNRDIPPIKNTNLYGTHPFYLCIEDDGNAMGFFLLNSNGMDVLLQPYPSITIRTIGGILDFFIYMGPSPSEVIQQHALTIGQSFMPPYYALGFHLCRFNYRNEDHLKEVIYRNRAAEIPYDTQWTDIDAMANHKDWTFDPVNFPSLPQIVADLHANGQHYINIIDPAISTTSGYVPYDTGVANDVFIKLFNSTDILIGKVWPGDTAFPDFTNPKTQAWWADMATRFYQYIKFDGLWIDMNEPSNFVDGSTKGCTNNSLDAPPYIPKVLGGTLYSRTLCPSSQQYLSNHYNLHNMYGHFEAIASNLALQAINNRKRPFVLTRSSYSGTGKWSAHWGGDNRATWEDLYYSIPNILNFNMFGVSMVGVDVCGFALDTTEELCIRWMQLGSFYPFMRNHNDKLAKDQDPAAFSVEAQLIMKKALNTRYLLLPYMYTLQYLSHTIGQPVARPLFFEFPTDLNTHSIDKQFLFGPALLITPVLQLGKDHVEAYFPNDTWYDFYTGAPINDTNRYITLDAPLSAINVHVRGGFIIPLQHPDVTTTISRKNPFSVLVALSADPSKPSYGSLFWDDGETIDTIQTNSYNIVNFNATQNSLTIQLDPAHMGYNGTMIFDKISVYGVQNRPTKVIINTKVQENWYYDQIHQSLIVQYLYLDLQELRLIGVTWM